jgi:hypothetical protein
MIININEVISFQRFLNVLKKCFKKRWDTVGELILSFYSLLSSYINQTFINYELTTYIEL